MLRGTLQNYILAAVLSSLSTLAFAENWFQLLGLGVEPIMSFGQNTQFHSQDETEHKLWVRADYPHGEKRVVGGDKIGRLMWRLTIRCTDRKTSTGETLSYDRDLRIVDRTGGTPDRFDEVPPDSLNEYLVTSFCDVRPILLKHKAG